MIDFDIYLVINIVIMFITMFVVLCTSKKKIYCILDAINMIAWLGYAIVMQKYYAFSITLATIYMLDCLGYGCENLNVKKKK